MENDTKLDDNNIIATYEDGTIETEAVVVIFKRKQIKSNKSGNNNLTFVYKPISIARGAIQSLDGSYQFLCINKETEVEAFKEEDPNNEEFFDESGFFDFHPMDDLDYVDDKYVFAFPIPTDSRNDEDIKYLMKAYEYIVDKYKETPIFQVVFPELGESKTFTTQKDLIINIDTNKPFESIEMEEEDFQAVRDFSTSLTEYKNNEKETNNLPYSDEIYDYISKTVLCQDEQIKRIAGTIAKNLRIKDPKAKTNILVIGPSGVGKTQIFDSLAECINIPFIKEDANSYSATSYKGKEVTEILEHLLDAAHGDISAAEHGIVYIDEIDKKADKSGEHPTYTKAVLDNLLSMAEGGTYFITKNEIPFDTSFVTFAFGGAFSGIEEYLNDKKHNAIGFNSHEETKDTKTKEQKLTNALIKYGFSPEFVGRTPLLIQMNSLNEEELKKIVLNGNKSQLILYRDLLKDLDINFLYTDEAIDLIARKAKDLGLGARSLNTIIKSVLGLAEYELFSKEKYSELSLTTENDELTYKLKKKVN